MKLVCNVSVGNRLLPNLCINSNRKHVKSTLALCKHPKSADYCIIHFSGQNKNGTKYNVKGNIQQVLTRFLQEGKVTIQFREPQHDLYIQADSIQMKSFLHLLKLVLQNKMEEAGNVKVSNIDVTPVNLRTIAPKKLVITKRSEFPVKGLPRTLEILRMNDIRRCTVDRGIWQLTKLKILDLSHNCITFLPFELSKMPCLTELDVSHNEMGKATPKQWDWIGGCLSSNLKLLNISNNNLQFLPNHIHKLFALITLNVNDNQLKSLPHGIGNLKNLRILTASNNLLTLLPGSFRKLQLHDLDLSNNQFSIQHQMIPVNCRIDKLLTVCSLKELAGSKVLSMWIPYSPDMLPSTVCYYLDTAKFCICGRACFDTCIKHDLTLRLNFVAQKVSVSANELTTVPIECCFCSLRCYNNTKSYRNPII